MQYISSNVHVPWEDMRYVFGQIMYGGHITDAWDRRCNNTYLDVYMQPNILHGCELAPGFKVRGHCVFMARAGLVSVVVV